LRKFGGVIAGEKIKVNVGRRKAHIGTDVSIHVYTNMTKVRPEPSAEEKGGQTNEGR
jgi:hypothetical protein